MSSLGLRMLCLYSKAKGFDNNKLRLCPLQLKAGPAQLCPCRKRVQLGPDLRVLTCTFPNFWNGTPVKNDTALTKSINEKHETKLRKKKEQRMSTELTTQADAAKKPQGMDYSVMTMDRQMAYRMYQRISDPVAYIMAVGQMIYDSKMLGVNSVAQGRMMALAGYLEGRSPFDYGKTYHIVDNKLTMRSEAMLAGFRDRGGDHDQVSRDENLASITLIRGKKKQTYSFSWVEALKEDFVYTKAAIGGQVPKVLPGGAWNPVAVKDNYRTPHRRKQMLWARVVSDACTAFCPEVKAGCYTPEEFDEILDTDGNVVEGEFHVVEEKAKANQAAAETAPTSYTEAAQAATPPTTAAASTPPTTAANPPTDPKPAATTTTTTPAEIVYPERGQPGFDEFQTALLTHVVRIKDNFLGVDQYKALIASKGVASAKEFDLKTLHTIVMKLEDKMLAAGKMSEAEHTIARSLRPAGN